MPFRRRANGWPRPARGAPLAGALSAALVLACALAGALAGAGGAARADDGGGADGGGADGSGGSRVTWSVAPAGPGGPDGRRWFELEAGPGEVVVDRVAVRNLSAADAVFELAAADGYFTREGRFAMLDRPQESAGAGTWVEAPASVEVPAGGVVVVPFTVRVPPGAEPGDHAAGLAAGLVSAKSSQDGSASLGVVSRFGLRLMVRVLGDLEPSFHIQGVGVSYRGVWAPSRPGRARAGFEVVNTGNARLVASGSVSVQGRSLAWPTQGEPVVELLPGASRWIEVEVPGVWPAFRVRAAVGAVAAVVALEGVAVPADPPPARASGWAWAIPWPQLGCLAGLALLAWSVLAARRRTNRRLAQAVAQARAEERAKHQPPTPQ